MGARSYLYVPGDRPERVVKALASGADAVIVDLEDAVAVAAKPAARQGLAQLPDTAACEVWVRINSGAQCAQDLAAIPFDRVHGIVVAKCDSSAWVGHVSSRVPPAVRVAPLIESAAAVAALADICGHPRTFACHLGETDLLADLGGTPEGGEPLLQPARIAAVYASAAARITGPVGGVHLAITDLASLRESSLMLRGLGFSGRAVIHPRHVDAVNEAFTPTDGELTWAADVLAKLDVNGVSRGSDDHMVDEAVARRARRLLGQD